MPRFQPWKTATDVSEAVALALQNEQNPTTSFTLRQPRKDLRLPHLSRSGDLDILAHQVGKSFAYIKRLRALSIRYHAHKDAVPRIRARKVATNISTTMARLLQNEQNPTTSFTFRQSLKDFKLPHLSRTDDLDILAGEVNKSFAYIMQLRKLCIRDHAFRGLARPRRVRADETMELQFAARRPIIDK